MTQTALQQAIAELRKRGNLIPPRSNIGVGLSMAINTISEFLELEKEKTIEFGKKVADHWGMTEVPKDNIEKYYNEQYGQGSPDK